MRSFMQKIETDESVQKEEAESQLAVTEDELEVAAQRFSTASSRQHGMNAHHIHILSQYYTHTHNTYTH